MYFSAIYIQTAYTKKGQVSKALKVILDKLLATNPNPLPNNIKLSQLCIQQKPKLK